MNHVPAPACCFPFRQHINHEEAAARHARLRAARFDPLELVDQAADLWRCRRCGFEAWRRASGRLECRSCGSLVSAHRCSDRRAEHGQALIEFALITPLLLLLLLGGIDVSFLMLDKQIVDRAAFAGARLAAVDQAADDAAVIALAQTATAQGIGWQAPVVITVDRGVPQRVTVTVTATYDGMLPGFHGVTVAAAATAALEYQP